MKYSLIILCVLFCSVRTFAQNNVGIGTNNPRNSAILDLYSSTQGLLLPRVDTLSIIGLGALDHGLMVYDTTISKILIWNGASWESISDDNSLQLAYDGGQTVNMGSGNINFISSSANSVLFIDEANERLGIGTSTPSAGFKLEVVGGDIQVNGLRMGRGTGGILNNLAIGANALNNNPTGGLNLAIGNTALQQTSTGGSNLAIGTGALIFNTTGSSNTIVGHDAMRAPAGSNQNTGIGEGIMRNGATGNANTAIGYYSLRNKTGNSNSALGHNTGITLTAGDNNTFLGANADAGVATLTNATAIGANATVGASNAVVLGNNANVGIGTSTPTSKLEVIGDAAKFDSVIIVNGAQTGYVLTAADATGAASWQPTSGGNSWELLGNAGTNPASDFLGTTDNTSLVLRTNNTAKLTINPNGDIDMSGAELRMFDAALGLGATKIVDTGIGGLIEGYDPAHSIYLRTGFDGSSDRLELHEFGTIGFYTGGAIGSQVERIHIGFTGNIGIGTSTPANKLEVIGDAAKFDSVIIANNAQAGYVLTAADASGAASWQPGGGGSAWDLTGNAGTVDGSNFIGTTDNVPLSFRFNNLPSGKLDGVSTSFGLDALSSLTTGIDNTAFGVSALQLNTIGIRSTALGRDALQFNTTGSSNTAVGYQSLNFNTVGVENTATGYQALQFNVDGSRNTGNGTTTLYQNTSGSDNSAFGYQALFSNTIGINNTADGTWALQNNTTGNSNTSIGFQALNINTTGSDNTAIGANANVTTSALTNATAIGANTIVSQDNSLVLGNNANVGIGTSAPTNKLEVIGDAAKFDSVIIANNAQAGYVLTAADASGAASWQPATGATAWDLLGNTGTNAGTNFIGTSDAQDLTFRTNNVEKLRITQQGQLEVLNTGNSVFIGESAGASDDLSNRANVYIGAFAGAANVSGGNNVGIGNNALGVNTADQNTAVGDGALSSNVTGSQNTAFGVASITQNVDGLRNVGFGLNSLFQGTSINDNVAIGYGALFSNQNDVNVALGNDALSTNTTGFGNVGIGHSALNANISGSRNSSLGYLTNTGSAALNNATAIGAHAQVDQSNSIVLGSINGINGAASDVNVGIGTTTPANKLEVIGDAAKFDSVIIANNAQAGYVLTAADASGAASWQPTAGGVSGTGATNKLAYWSAANTLAFNTGLHYESANQRLGLGTSAPAEFLHVNSGNPITVASRFTNASTGSTGSDGFGFGITGTGNAFINNDEATPINISTASVTRMTIDATGNVGIGTLTPTNKLSVIGQSTNGAAGYFENNIGGGIDGSALRVLNSGARSIGNNGMLIQNQVTKVGGNNSTKTGLKIESTGAWGVATVNQPNIGLDILVSGADNNYAAIFNGGNVGIGTNAPNAPLQFANTLVNRKIVLFDPNNNDHEFFGFGVNGGALRYQVNAPGSHIFYTSASSTTSTELMRIDGTGNVGIGTNAPAARLEVAGGNIGMGIDRSIGLNQAGDNYTYDGQTVGSYSLGWYQDTWNGFGATSWLSGYAGIKFLTDQPGQVRMAITQGGNVGIGTNTPAFKLDVVGQARISDNILFGNSAGAATGDFRIDGFQNELSLHAENFNAANVSTSIGFHTASPLSASTRKMIITGSGNVGIGTSTPSYKLDVVGDNGVRIAPAAGGENFLTLVNASTSTPSWGINDNTNRDLAFYRYDGVGGFLNTSLLIQNSTGNVGIGRDNISLNPTTALYVAENNGNGPVATFRNTYGGGPVAPQGISIIFDDNDLGGNRYITFQRAGIGEIGSVQGSNGSVFYATTSDRRLKTNIKDFDGALDLVKAIRPREYSYKVDLDRTEYGFIAQELQLVLPQVVSGSPDGDVKTNPMMVDYSRITPVLTKAIQEQQLLIENQQKIIDSQKAELEELKSSNNDLKSTDKNTQVQLDLMQAQIDRLNTILSAEASK